VPSAGDWALERFAAVYLSGTEGATFDGCTFERLDGNAVMVSGYNRNATVSNSDFAFIGGNVREPPPGAHVPWQLHGPDPPVWSQAVAAWGFTNETATDPARPGMQLANFPEAGVDGTDGEHPRYTKVVGCSAREIGLYEKQSSFFVQAKTAQSFISGNVFFNGPRAGINANDGFGGGDEISHNLVFSTCRESGDHGAHAAPPLRPGSSTADPPVWSQALSTRGTGSHSSPRSTTGRPRCRWRGARSVPPARFELATS
jgi:hypothetical protein